LLLATTAALAVALGATALRARARATLAARTLRARARLIASSALALFAGETVSVLTRKTVILAGESVAR
jgi:hypothetical protein